MCSVSLNVGCLSVAIALIATASATAQPSEPSAESSRVTISVSGAQQAARSSFSQISTLRVNQEDGSVEVGYVRQNSPLWDVGVGVKVQDRLWVTVAVSSLSKKSDALVSAEIPHPLFFGQQRAVDGTVSGVTHRETAVHVDAAWGLPVEGKLSVQVFGGPTFFSVAQDVVSDVTYSEAYPFDTALFTGASTTRGKKSTVGFNAGADVTLFLTSRVGVGGQVRFSRGTAKVGTPLGGSVSMGVGGLEVGGGLRLRF